MPILDPASMSRLSTVLPQAATTTSSGQTGTPLQYNMAVSHTPTNFSDPLGVVKTPVPANNGLNGPVASHANTLLTNASQQSASPAPSTNVSKDSRVRIALPAGAGIFYKTAKQGTVLYPLALTDGVVFPFQPKVDIVYKANYETQQPVHSNFVFPAYKNSGIDAITISGDFSVRTPYEGLYVIACMTFLRSLTMMFTAQDGSRASGIPGGTPPQVARLWGMGFGGLDNMPVVITSVTTNYPDDVNFVTINVPVAAGNQVESTKIPTKMNISVSAMPIFSRAFASGFSVLDYASGTQRLLGSGYK